MTWLRGGSHVSVHTGTEPAALGRELAGERSHEDGRRGHEGVEGGVAISRLTVAVQGREELAGGERNGGGAVRVLRRRGD